MKTPTLLYDFLRTYWPPVDDGFAAVWVEGTGIEETASRLRADLDSATVCPLRGIGRGFDGDDRPDDYAGIVLVGESGSWTLAVQIQGMDVTTDRALAELSRDGGRAISIGWHANGGHTTTYAVDGTVVSSGDIRYVPPSLEHYAQDLRIPDFDDEDSDDFPIEEMITKVLVVIGRATGQEIDEDWLEEDHVRYIIPRDAWMDDTTF
ncbi:hypothetical protein ACFYY8_15100 [Streptosporangium sp. NPDC001559]|uniref:hypothetical protein n=1 Tax=Streptosporangium sp. NPDC001559 TaxID=3366187 RepID=UPI0036EDA5A4